LLEGLECLEILHAHDVRGELAVLGHTHPLAAVTHARDHVREAFTEPSAAERGRGVCHGTKCYISNIVYTMRLFSLRELRVTPGPRWGVGPGSSTGAHEGLRDAPEALSDLLRGSLRPQPERLVPDVILP